jgi:hypothetical protein
VLIDLLNKDSGTDLEVPFRVATTEVVAAEVSAVAVTVKPAVVDPPGTVTEAGKVTPVTAVPRFNPTLIPVVGAAAPRVTVHAEVPGVGTVPGLQAIALSVTAGGCSASEKFVELPPTVATRTAVATAETLAALAVKLALVAPAAITTDAGIVTCAAVLPTPSVTVTGAVPTDFKLTVHAELPGVTSVPGLHEIPEKMLPGAMATVVPVAVAPSVLAAGDTPCGKPT